MNAEADRTTAAPRLLDAQPQLFVSDIAASCDFFRDLLGFQVAFVYGEPSFYAQVFRDGARLNLRHADRPAFDEDFLAIEPDVLSATITVEDAKALFLEYQSAGVSFHQSLRSEPWGARTFIVADPDDNLIAFAGASKPAS
jgi:catechol 2,3-dioxygenase-like lactoylglutathione lyase family enzyme